MRRKILGGLVAAAVLAACVGSASAHRLSLSSSTLRVTWAQWTPQIVYGGVAFTVSCPMTLEGSFHSRTIEKSVGSLIGYYTRAAINEAGCRSRERPEARLGYLTAGTLPWHMRYRSFSGLLPTITAVAFEVLGPAIRVTGLPFGTTCLYRTTAAAPQFDQFEVAAGGAVTYTTGGFISLSEGGLGCGERMDLSGMAGVVTVQGGTASITVTLI